MSSVPNGVYPTMITPYQKDLQVDYGVFPELMRWYEDRKVTGVFAICQSSEIFYLSFEERLQILKAIMKTRKPGTVVVASGHTSYDPATQIKEAQAFIAEGIDAYVFITNRFADKSEDDDTFLRRVDHVTRELPDVPLGFYECPHPYNRLLSPAVLKQLVNVANFAFLKDTCCDLDAIKAKLEITKDTGFKIFNANSAQLLESLRLGAAGFSGVMGNFHPQLYTKLCECWQEDPALAERIQDFCGLSSMATGNYPVTAKYSIALDGVPMTWLSRSGDASKLRRCDQMGVEQMRRCALALEASYK